MTDAEAAGLTETLRVLLDVVGDGVTLTGAGYLPPAIVQPLAERSGITGWWTRCRRDPQAMWQHIVGRLPLGKKDFDRHAGWLALAVAGSGVPPEDPAGRGR